MKIRRPNSDSRILVSNSIVFGGTSDTDPFMNPISFNGIVRPRMS